MASSAAAAGVASDQQQFLDEEAAIRILLKQHVHRNFISAFRMPCKEFPRMHLLSVPARILQKIGEKHLNPNQNHKQQQDPKPVKVAGRVRGNRQAHQVPRDDGKVAAGPALSNRHRHLIFILDRSSSMGSNFQDLLMPACTDICSAVPYDSADAVFMGKTVTQAKIPGANTFRGFANMKLENATDIGLGYATAVQRAIEHHQEHGANRKISYFFLFFSDGADTVAGSLQQLRESIVNSSQMLREHKLLTHFIVVGIGEQSDTRIGMTAKIASTSLEMGERMACVHFARHAKSLGKAVNTLIGELSPSLAGFHVHVALPGQTRRLQVNAALPKVGIVECFGEPVRPEIDVQIGEAANKELLLLCTEFPESLLLNDFQYNVEVSNLPPLDIDVLRIVRTQAQALRIRMVAGQSIDLGIRQLQNFANEGVTKKHGSPRDLVGLSPVERLLFLRSLKHEVTMIDSVIHNLVRANLEAAVRQQIHSETTLPEAAPSPAGRKRSSAAAAVVQQIPDNMDTNGRLQPAAGAPRAPPAAASADADSAYTMNSKQAAIWLNSAATQKYAAFSHNVGASKFDAVKTTLQHSMIRTVGLLEQALMRDGPDNDPMLSTASRLSLTRHLRQWTDLLHGSQRQQQVAETGDPGEGENPGEPEAKVAEDDGEERKADGSFTDTLEAMMVSFGAVGPMITTDFNSTQFVFPWKTEVLYVSPDLMDTASALCGLQGGFFLQDRLGRLGQDCMLLVDHRNTELSVPVFDSAFMRAQAALVVARDPTNQPPEQPLALMLAALGRTLWQLAQPVQSLGALQRMQGEGGLASADQQSAWGRARVDWMRTALNIILSVRRYLELQPQMLRLIEDVVRKLQLDDAAFRISALAHGDEAGVEHLNMLFGALCCMDWPAPKEEPLPGPAAQQPGEGGEGLADPVLQWFSQHKDDSIRALAPRIEALGVQTIMDLPKDAWIGMTDFLAGNVIHAFLQQQQQQQNEKIRPQDAAGAADDCPSLHPVLARAAKATLFEAVCRSVEDRLSGLPATPPQLLLRLMGIKNYPRVMPDDMPEPPAQEYSDQHSLEPALGPALKMFASEGVQMSLAVLNFALQLHTRVLPKLREASPGLLGLQELLYRNVGAEVDAVFSDLLQAFDGSLETSPVQRFLTSLGHQASIKSSRVFQIGMMFAGLRFCESPLRKLGDPEFHWELLDDAQQSFKLTGQLARWVRKSLYQQELRRKETRQVLARRLAHGQRLTEQELQVLENHRGLPVLFSPQQIEHLNRLRPGDDQLELVEASGMLRHHCGYESCGDYLNNFALPRDLRTGTRYGIFRHVKLVEGFCHSLHPVARKLFENPEFNGNKKLFVRRLAAQLKVDKLVSPSLTLQMWLEELGSLYDQLCTRDNWVPLPDGQQNGAAAPLQQEAGESEPGEPGEPGEGEPGMR